MTKTWLVTITTPRRDKFYCNTLRDFFFFWRGPAAGQNHLQKKNPDGHICLIHQPEPEHGGSESFKLCTASNMWESCDRKVLILDKL